MKESRIMTILYKGKTEEDIMEMLDNKGIKYEWWFSVAGEDSEIEYTSDKTYKVKFHNGICVGVLSN
jgi:hypothetical protein